MQGIKSLRHKKNIAFLNAGGHNREKTTIIMKWEARCCFHQVFPSYIQTPRISSRGTCTCIFYTSCVFLFVYEYVYIRWYIHSTHENITNILILPIYCSHFTALYITKYVHICYMFICSSVVYLNLSLICPFSRGFLTL